MSKQQLFNDVSKHLRTYGNPYGTKDVRGWGFNNYHNPNDKCAIASLVDTTTCIVDAVETKYNLERGSFWKCHFLKSIMDVFDYAPEICNDKDRLEDFLYRTAMYNNLQYITEESKQTEKELVFT